MSEGTVGVLVSRSSRIAGAGGDGSIDEPAQARARSWQQLMVSSRSLLAASVSSLGHGLRVLGEDYLHVLPEPVAEFADSRRAVALARIPGCDGQLDFRAALTYASTGGGGERALKNVVITTTGILYR